MAKTVDGDHTDKYIDNINALDAYYRETLELLDAEFRAERTALYAAQSQINGDRLLVCPECRDAVVKALNSQEETG